LHDEWYAQQAEFTETLESAKNFEDVELYALRKSIGAAAVIYQLPQRSLRGGASGGSDFCRRSV